MWVAGVSHYPQRGVCFSSGSFFFGLRRLWKLFREINSLEFWNLQNERLQNEGTGHSNLLALVLFSCLKSAFCPSQKQWEILHGCSRGCHCQGLVWQDPPLVQGSGLSAVPVLGSCSSAIAQEQPAVQWNRSHTCPSTEQFPSFSLWHISQKEHCATCAGVQTNRGLVLYHCHNTPSAQLWGSPCLLCAVLSTWRSAVKLDSMGQAQSAGSTVCQGKNLWLFSLGSNETEEERPNYKNEILV